MPFREEDYNEEHTGKTWREIREDVSQIAARKEYNVKDERLRNPRKKFARDYKKYHSKQGKRAISGEDKKTLSATLESNGEKIDGDKLSEYDAKTLNIRENISETQYKKLMTLFGKLTQMIDEIPQLKPHLKQLETLLPTAAEKIKPAEEREELGPAPETTTRLKDATQILGGFDLRKLNKRDAVYDYWEKINSRKLKDKVQKELDGLEKVFENHETLAEDYAKMVSAFAKVKDYIVKVEATTIEVPSAEQKAVQILMDLVRDAPEQIGAGMELQSSEEDIDTIEEILLGKLEVDPLYSYVVTGGYTPGEMVSASDIEEIKFEIREITSVLGEDFIGEIDEVINELEGFDMDMGKRGTYYLPITSELQSALNLDDDYAGIMESHKTFLESVSNFFEGEVTASKTITPATDDLLGLEIAGRGKRARRKPGILGSDRKELKEKSDELLDFVQALKEYYTKPLNSKYFPFEEEHPLKNNNTLLVLAKYDSKILDEFIRRKTLFSGVSITNSFIRKYRVFLDNLSSTQFDPLSDRFKKNLTALVKELTRMFSKENRELVVKDTLNVVAEVLKQEGSPIPDLVIYGIDIEEADKSDLPYSPLQLISDELKQIGGKYQDKYRASVYRSVQPDIKAIRANLQKEVFRVIKSDISHKLLVAHDGIRKMKGLPVYYRFADLENVEHMNDTLDVIKSDGYDISALDVERIVKEVDSHSSIAKQYGVNTETVYKLKALFR